MSGGFSCDAEAVAFLSIPYYTTKRGQKQVKQTLYVGVDKSSGTRYEYCGSCYSRLPSNEIFNCNCPYCGTKFKHSEIGEY